MRIHSEIFRGVLVGALLGGPIWVAGVAAAQIPLSNFPILLEEGVPPNVVLTVDDSDSMAEAVVPLIGDTNVTDPAYSDTPNKLYLHFQKMSDELSQCEDAVSSGEDACGLTAEACRTTCADAETVCTAACLGDAACEADCADVADACVGVCDAAELTCKDGVARDCGQEIEDKYGVDPNDIVHAYYSSHVNGVYYNPDIVYEPPLKADGTKYPNANFGGAWVDGFDQSEGTMDLGSGYTQTVSCRLPLPEPMRPTSGASTTTVCLDMEAMGTAAFYYQFKGSASCTEAFDLSCYDKKTIDSTKQQNFANWFSYYRTSMLAAKTAMSRAFSGLIGSVRVGYQALAKDATKVTKYVSIPVPPYSVPVTYYDLKLHSVAPFEGSHKDSFFSWIADLGPIGKSTPLHSAVYSAGEYFSTDAPYRDDPADSTSSVRSCRENHHLLFTDGSWGGDGGINTFSPGDTNWDNQSLITLPDGDDYTSIDSYKSGEVWARLYKGSKANMLADMAMYYWVTDLRGSMTNDVPSRIVDSSTELDGDASAISDLDEFWSPRNDPARWQHMVNHVIGLGVVGTLTYPADEANLIADTVTWGDDRIDDLWHTAVNSRGSFFSVKKPEELVEALMELTAGFNIGVSSAASLSVNSGTLYSGSLLFQATFNTDSWYGDVIAYAISSGASDPYCSKGEGELCEKWHAGTILTNSTNWTTREIISFNPGSGGSRFAWDPTDSNGLNTYQKTALDGTDGRGSERVDYLRGDRGKEESYSGCTSDCDFRDRSGILGDIVNAAPLYVGPPQRVYTDSSYQTFRDTTYANRTPMLYVGANDGMLHAFRADLDGSMGGHEMLAYVPNEVYDNLALLTDPNYDNTHRFYVDGPLNEGDVQVGTTWYTLLAGGLGKGGQAVFALNITNPVSTDFAESKAKDLVFWEFSDAADADMGYLYAKPAIAKLPNGKWAVIFGNGYNNTESCPSGATAAQCQASSTGDAAMYLVYTGYTHTFTSSDFIKVPIEWGTAEDPTGDSRANGLATVTVVDTDSDLVADVVYAGDLFGNVWKVKLDSSGASLGFSKNPLFTAKDSGGKVQPITTKIRVMEHPRGVGYLLLFGTGKYLGQSDAENKDVQTFYGIWDDGSTYGFTRSKLQQQKIEEEGTHSGGKTKYRVTSNNSVDWTSQMGWYLDLLEGGTTANGERLMWDPQLRQNRIMFVTVLPHPDPCQSEGADSWVNVLDARDGSRLKTTYPPFFDADLNGVFDSDDLVTQTDGTKVIQSSIKIGTDKAVYTAPSTISSGDTLINYFADSTGGEPVKLLESSGLVGRMWMDVR